VKKPLRFALILGMALLMGSLICSAPAQATTSSVEVTTEAGLRAALLSKDITAIQIRANLALKAYPYYISNQKSSLVIYGNGYTVTQVYNSPIVLDSDGTLKNITVNGMNVVGADDRGFVWVIGWASPSASRASYVTFQNVNYTGPALGLIEGSYGQITIKDCTVALEKGKFSTPFELADCANVVFEGNVNVTRPVNTVKDTECVLRLRGTSCLIKAGANVNVTNRCTGPYSSFIKADSSSIAFKVEEGASFSYSGYDQFTRGSALASIEVARGASAKISITANNGITGNTSACIYVNGNVDVNPSATLDIESIGSLEDNSSSVIRLKNLYVNDNATFKCIAKSNTKAEAALSFTGSDANLTIGYPALFEVYNGYKASSNAKNGRAIASSSSVSVSVAAVRASMFYNQNSVLSYPISASASKVWGDGVETFTLTGTLSSGIEFTKATTSGSMSGTTKNDIKSDWANSYALRILSPAAAPPNTLSNTTSSALGNMVSPGTNTTSDHLNNIIYGSGGSANTQADNTSGDPAVSTPNVASDIPAAQDESSFVPNIATSVPVAIGQGVGTSVGVAPLSKAEKEDIVNSKAGEGEDSSKFGIAQAIDFFYNTSGEFTKSTGQDVQAGLLTEKFKLNLEAQEVTDKYSQSGYTLDVERTMNANAAEGATIETQYSQSQTPGVLKVYYAKDDNADGTPDYKQATARVTEVFLDSYGNTLSTKDAGTFTGRASNTFVLAINSDVTDKYSSEGYSFDLQSTVKANAGYTQASEGSLGYDSLKVAYGSEDNEIVVFYRKK